MYNPWPDLNEFREPKIEYFSYTIKKSDEKWTLFKIKTSHLLLTDEEKVSSLFYCEEGGLSEL